ncbi:MAG: nucleotidyltransferase [Clostridiales bacterium]|nr:nucleotidyltransferase [Clostridiales bacterium]
MPEITLLVLAAGIGKRYGGLKQVDSVGPSGEAILDYSLYDALRAGFSRVVFVIRKEIEESFRQAVGLYWERRLSTQYVFQEIEGSLPGHFAVPASRHKPWGTGHAVLVSRDAIETPFAVINADDFYGPSAYRDVFSWLEHHSILLGKTDEYCFVGYRLANTLSDFGSVSRGVCSLDGTGFLSQVVETMGIAKDGRGARALDESGRLIPLSGDQIASMNMWGFTPSVYAHLTEGFASFLRRFSQDTEAEFFLPSAVNELIKTGKARVRYIPTEEKWFGLTYPGDLKQVRLRLREFIAAGVYPDKIRQ